MSGECSECGNHALECVCSGINFRAPSKLAKFLNDHEEKMNEEIKEVTIGTPNEIVFCAEAGKWVMKLTEHEGILFNRERYPDSKPDDFAEAVIEILEKAFTIKFERKKPPYNRVDMY